MDQWSLCGHWCGEKSVMSNFPESCSQPIRSGSALSWERFDLPAFQWGEFFLEKVASGCSQHENEVCCCSNLFKPLLSLQQSPTSVLSRTARRYIAGSIGQAICPGYTAVKIFDPFLAMLIWNHLVQSRNRSGFKEKDNMHPIIHQVTWCKDSSEHPHPPCWQLGMYENEDALEHYWTLLWDAALHSCAIFFTQVHCAGGM